MAHTYIHIEAGADTDTDTDTDTLVHEALSYWCMRPYAAGVCGHPLLVYEALRYVSVKDLAQPRIFKMRGQSSNIHAAL